MCHLPPPPTDLPQDKWLPLVKGVRCPVVPARIGKEAGIIGAAARARRQMMYRDDLARVRQSIGQRTSVSPQLLTDTDLRKARADGHDGGHTRGA